MTVEEIFGKIAAIMIKGMMTHEQFADYYDFLGLCGYKRCHEYHSILEGYEYRKLNRFYINYYNKLVPESPVENPHIIPESWYRYTRQDVDNNTKQKAVKEGLEKWLKWEKEVRQMYCDFYKELTELHEIKAAMYVEELICGVSKEIKSIERYYLNLRADGYFALVVGFEQGKNQICYQRNQKQNLQNDFQLLIPHFGLLSF